MAGGRDVFEAVGAQLAGVELAGAAREIGEEGGDVAELAAFAFGESAAEFLGEDGRPLHAKRVPVERGSGRGGFCDGGKFGGGRAGGIGAGGGAGVGFSEPSEPRAVDVAAVFTEFAGALGGPLAAREEERDGKFFRVFGDGGFDVVIGLRADFLDLLGRKSRFAEFAGLGLEGVEPRTQRSKRVRGLDATDDGRARAGAHSGLVNVLFQESEKFSLGDAALLHGVAVAEGKRVARFLDRVEIDRHAPRRANLILATVTAADGGRLVVKHGVAALEFFVERLGAGDEHLFVFEEREDGDFDRRDARAEAEYGACLGVTLFVGDGLFGVAGAEDGEEDAIDADGWLDDVRDEFLFRGFVEDFLRFAGGVGVLREIVAAAGGDAPELLHAKRIFEHDVHRAAGVKREFLLRMRVAREVRVGQADALQPRFAPSDPLFVDLGPIGVFVDEIFHLHLFKFARAENEVARRDLVAERLADLRNTERQFHATGIDDVFEINKHALRRLRPQISDGRTIGHGADVRLEHHVKRARSGEAAGFAGGRRGDQRDLVFARFGEVFGDDRRERALNGFFAFKRLGGALKFARGIFTFKRGDVADGLRDAVCAGDDDRRKKQLVRAVALLRNFAVHERIAEAGDVAGGLPDLGVHDDRSLDAHDIVAALHHVGPPAIADVLLQLSAQRTVIEETVETAVDLGRLENKAAAFRKRDEVIHRNGSRGGGSGSGGV